MPSIHKMNGTSFDRVPGLRYGPLARRSDGIYLLDKGFSKYHTRALIDNAIGRLNFLSEPGYLQTLAACESDLAELYAACVRTYPDFGVSTTDFQEAIGRAVHKYLVKFGATDRVLTAQEIRQFIRELQIADLYLALACACGNEQAWWEFDRTYRSFVERLSRHLVGDRGDADEAIDFVYAELFGTNTSTRPRQSKFKTYSGRGTLRGWLRAVVSHAVIDLHRGRPDEISLEDCCELDNRSSDTRLHTAPAHAVEDLLLEKVVRERYRSATLAALDQSLAKLDPHETLLLMYYHIDGLTLREIARMIENPTSPMRRWFKRRTAGGDDNSRSERIHESTIMRWLDKAYRKVSQAFHAELQTTHKLKAAEIDICMAIATEDLGHTVTLNAGESRDDAVVKGEGAA